jgi:hypothetical protein
VNKNYQGNLLLLINTLREMKWQQIDQYSGSYEAIEKFNTLINEPELFYTFNLINGSLRARDKALAEFLTGAIAAYFTKPT